MLLFITAIDIAQGHCVEVLTPAPNLSQAHTLSRVQYDQAMEVIEIFLVKLWHVTCNSCSHLLSFQHILPDDGEFIHPQFASEALNFALVGGSHQNYNHP